MIYYRWSGTAVAGQTVDLGSFISGIPSGKSFIGMFLTPLANVNISMSYINNDIYAYSDTFSGNFAYDVLMIVG